MYGSFDAYRPVGLHGCLSQAQTVQIKFPMKVLCTFLTSTNLIQTSRFMPKRKKEIASESQAVMHRARIDV